MLRESDLRALEDKLGIRACVAEQIIGRARQVNPASLERAMHAINPEALR